MNSLLLDKLLLNFYTWTDFICSLFSDNKCTLIYAISETREKSAELIREKRQSGVCVLGWWVQLFVSLFLCSLNSGHVQASLGTWQPKHPNVWLTKMFAPLARVQFRRYSSVLKLPLEHAKHAKVN
jgi:hypothetical protein